TMLREVLLRGIGFNRGHIQEQSVDLVTPVMDQPACEVTTIGCSRHDEVFCWGNLIQKGNNQVKYLILTDDRIGSAGFAHARQIRVQPSPSSSCCKERLHIIGDVPMVKRPAVQHEDGLPRSALLVIDRARANLTFHTAPFLRAGRSVLSPIVYMCGSSKHNT